LPTASMYGNCNAEGAIVRDGDVALAATAFQVFVKLTRCERSVPLRSMLRDACCMTFAVTF
jgi:hypothetical protein